jgi:serine/threonine protein kinase/Tfp pilus assembly protein PilF
MIGQTISHYKILEKLGEGGMGVVYKARDTKLDRTVALKFVSPQSLKTEEEKTRFIQEAKAAAAINHPNVTTIHEIDEVSGDTFISMEYIEGKSLKDKIDSGPLTIEEALKIAIQISEGLQEAHEKGIVHRDIKSANIMITDKGQVKIMDFGLAKLKGKSKLTKAGTTVGTASYMSPEQSMGKKVDYRTDIWSLGVVIYEMVTGQLPFKGDYEQAVVYSILNEEPEPITGLRTGVSIDIEKVIFKLLTKDPSDRYQHIDDLIVDLRKLKKDSKPEVTISKKKTSPEITLKTYRKMLILGGIFLVVIIIIAGYFIFKGKSEPETLVMKPGDKPSLAVVYFENKSGDKKLDNWRDAFSELLTTDLSQSKYIRVLRSDQIYGIFKKLNLLEAKRYSEQDLKEIAKNGQVNHILKGSFIKAGDKFVITATLINANNNETISTISVQALGEINILPKVDELTREIKSKLKLTNDQINTDIDKKIGEITTSSPEAYKHFIQGIKNHFNEEYRKCIQFMEKAVAVDPEFAIAYRYISQAYFNMGHINESRKYLQKAMNLIDRLSDREQYTIMGSFYGRSEKTLDKSIEVWKKLLKVYPDDVVGNSNLASSIYNHLEQWDKAIELLEVVIRGKNPTHWPFAHLQISYESKGLYQKAREVLEYYLNNFPDHYTIRLQLARNYIIQRKFDLALSEVEKAISLAPHIHFPHLEKGNIYFYQGDFSNAEKVYKNLLKFKEKTAQILGIAYNGGIPLVQGRYIDAERQFKKALKKSKEYDLRAVQAFSHQFVGYMYLLTRKYDKAIKNFTEALSIFKKLDLPLGQVWEQYFIAITLLEMKSLNQNQKAEDELLECVQNRMNKKLIRWYYLFLGQKEMKRNHFSKAIKHFKKALSLLPFPNNQPLYIQAHFWFINPLALAYFKSGNLDKAAEEYEKIITLTKGRIFCGDIYAKAFYQLGNIYQKKGWKGKAIDSYNKFIDLWKNCDPIFQPLVEDARKRVKELEGNK